MTVQLTATSEFLEAENLEQHFMADYVSLVITLSCGGLGRCSMVSIQAPLPR